MGVSKGSLYALVCMGAIPAYRPTPGSRSLRFKIADLDAYLESVRVEPGDLLHLLDEAVREKFRQLLEAKADRSCEGEGCAAAGPAFVDVDLDDVDLERLDQADAITN